MKRKEMNSGIEEMTRRQRVLRSKGLFHACLTADFYPGTRGGGGDQQQSQ